MQNPLRDPVCGMTVDPATARASCTYAGSTYHFCGPSCLQRFQADPRHYLGDQSPTAASDHRGPRPGTEYTCPMHPQIVRDQPGNCPICGMALEPRTVTLEQGPNPELVDMTRRFWIGVVGRSRQNRTNWFTHSTGFVPVAITPHPLTSIYWHRCANGVKRLLHESIVTVGAYGTLGRSSRRCRIQ
jgi:YHS domain-containing protein